MILLTGATGTIGRKLTQRLLGQGQRVRILALPNDPAAGQVRNAEAEIIFGDITNPDSLIPAVAGIETVYHMAAIILSPDPDLFRKVNIEGTRNLVMACEKAQVKHLIYVSSASVTYTRQNAYSRSKAEAEAIVRLSRIPHHTIVRPTLVYSEHGGAEFLHFVRYLKRYPVLFMIGNGAAKKSPVHTDDLVAGLSRINANPKTFGKTYNLSGNETISLWEISQIILARTGKKKLIIPIPVALCKGLSLAARWAGSLFRRHSLLNWQTISGMIQNADLDCSAAIRDLDYRPRSFREGIKNLTSL